MGVLPTAMVRDAGAEEAAYLGSAKAQMDILRTIMRLGGLNSHSRVVTLANGVTITCKKVFNAEDIYITVPDEIQQHTETAIDDRYAVFVVAYATHRSMFTPMVFPAVALGAGQPYTGTFFPVRGDNLAFPLYDGIRTAGETLLFSVPITSTHGESIVWQQLLIQPNTATGRKFNLITYQLAGYVGTYSQTTLAKIVLSQSTVNAFEFDFSAQNIFYAAGHGRQGVNFRRLRGVADVDRMIVCVQNDSTHSGQIYEVVESGDTLAFAPFGLDDLAAGNRLTAAIAPGGSPVAGARHVDWVYDIFTSSASAYFYIVKFCCDTAVTYNIYTGNPYPDDVQIFPGMALMVEKRAKSDLTLVTTYNLTPTALDSTLGGWTPAQISYNRANGQNDGYTTGGDDLTRIAPQGPGFVLIDTDGTEYPILPALVMTQQHFGSPTSARNLIQQSALLWLGGTAGDVAVGTDSRLLPIAEAVAGLTSIPLSLMSRIGTAIGDSAHVLLQSQGYDNQLVYFSVTSVSGLVATVECRFFEAFSAGDTLFISTGAGVSAYTVVSADLVGSGTAPQDNIVAKLLALDVPGHTLGGATSGYDGTGYYNRFTVTRDVAGEIDVTATFILPTQGQSNRRQLLSVQAVGGAPLVRLERVFSTQQSVTLHDI
jgi:hypothetical protein